MSPFLKPAFIVMDKLSYRYKFLLIASLFVLPLILLAGRLAINYQNTADQAMNSRESLDTLTDASSLIKHLEELRDTAVISFVYSGSSFDERYEKAKQTADFYVDRLTRIEALRRHRSFLEKLQLSIREHRISEGNEATLIENIFENANSLVDQAYLWRLKLSYELISKSEVRNQYIGLLDLVNSSDKYLLVLGKTRALGSSYLVRQFIDSNGILALDRTYLDYSRLISDLDIKRAEYEQLLDQAGLDALKRIRNKLVLAQQMLDEHLLQAMDLTADPIAFYEEVTGVIEAFHEHNKTLQQRTDELLDTQHQIARNQLLKFYIGAVFMGLLALYLYIGFFTNVRRTIKSLVTSAQRVANGRYEQPVSITAKDELQMLAKAMDEMRQKLKGREEELTLISETDGLSRLKNRQYFDEALPVALANCQRNSQSLCLVMMDIDHFKSINDQYGHQVGDQFIQQVSNLFQTYFKRKSDIVARYGGEEFIAILCDTELEETIAITERLREQIASHTIQVDESELSVTASFGIVVCDSSEIARATPPGLVKACDGFLYQAKDDGRNCVRSGRYIGNGEHVQEESQS